MEEKRLTPAWNIFVESDENDPDLKNALLYADKVHWISTEMIAADVYGGTFRPTGGGWREFSPTPPTKYGETLFKIRDAGLTGCISPIIVPWEVEGLSITERGPLILKRVAEAVKDSKCIVSPVSDSRKPWNTYQAVVELQSAITRLVLTDVAELPFEAIFEIRDRTADVLDPMRAELLRLTEALRMMVESTKNGPRDLRSEAESLVATKVEPIVLEAAGRTKDLARQKWRKLLKGAAKSFGLAGASLFDPNLIGKAIAQTLETSAQALGRLEDKTPGPKHTAQFVLQAHRIMTEKY